MDPGASARRRLERVTVHLAANTVRSSPEAPVAEQLQALLDHDSHEERRRMKEIMATDPLFVPKWNVGLNEERELALRRLKRLCDSKNFSIRDFRTDPMRIFVRPISPFTFGIFAHGRLLVVGA